MRCSQGVEIRAFDFEVRAEHDEQHGHFISGRPIVFGRKTDLGLYDEIIERGALDSTDLRDVAFLVNHNTDMIPLARSRNNNASSTMQMSVDDDGMTIRVNLDIARNADARALYSAVERGDISGMSYMFAIDAQTWEDAESDHPLRRINKISRVFEVSAVTYPAYADTSITTRGLSSALDSALAALESARAAKREIERKKHKIKIMMEV